jgi:thioredoxin-dependent peroxiredoxin
MRNSVPNPTGTRLTAWAVSLLVVVSSLVAACSDAKRPDGGKGLLAVGARAPEVSALNASGATVRLSSTAGTRVVYFYPKDETPGCTKEACAFRDAFDAYSTAGITIFGVSGDSPASHAKFRKEHDLPFPLASDENGTIAASYGVKTRLGMPQRITFLVDSAGLVTRVFEDVDPAVHAEQVLAAAK